MSDERRMNERTMLEIEQAFDWKLRDHEQREQERFAKLVDAIVHEAFPDGAAAHRIAHQAMIDAANSEADFWRGLKLEIAKKSIWGVLQILLILTIAGVAAKFGLAPSAITWLSK